MPQHRDQYELVTRLLGKMGLADKWHVVEPVPGDGRNYVRIQNSTDHLEAYVEVSALDADVLGQNEEEMMNRIRRAIAHAGRRVPD